MLRLKVFVLLSQTGAAASNKTKSTASSALNRVSEKTRGLLRRVDVAIKWEDSKTDAARQLLSRSVKSSTAIGQRTKQTLLSSFESLYSRTTSRTVSVRDQATQLTLGVLASDFSREMDRWLTRLLSGPATIYDKAMDATYLTTYVGGSYHRLFDGGHSLLGAIKAGHTASSDDSIIQEAVGTVSAIFKDLVTVRGLPFLTWDKATFDNVASILESNLHIPKSWFYNLNTFGVAELLTSTIGTLAIALNWNSEDREAFSKIIGSTAIVSTLSANPILLIVTLAALAKSFSDARREGNYTEFVEGLAKGGVVTGAVIATSSVVAGPVFVGLLAGLCAGILANKAMDNVSIVQIRDYLVVSFNTAIKNAKYSQNQSS